MPPIKSPEYIEGIPPEESVRQKSEMIDRAEHLADLVPEIGINPPVPDEDFKYYVFEKDEEEPGKVVTRLKIMEHNAANNEHKETPLVLFHRSAEVVPEDRVFGVSLRYPREIRVPVRRNDQVEWTPVEPGSQIYEDIEDTITYTEKYLEKAKNSFVDKVVVKICSLVFSNIQSQ